MLSSLTTILGIQKMVQIVAEKHVYSPGKSNTAKRTEPFLHEKPPFLNCYSLFSPR